MLHKEPLIIKGRKWNKSLYQGYNISYAGDINPKELLKIVKKIDNINEINKNDIKNLFEKINGKFAFIVFTKNIVFAAVDRIKSIPIFIGSNEKKFQLSNHAAPLAKNMNLNNINNNACLSIVMSGYTTGKETIVKGLNQLMAGESFIWKNNKKYLYKYYNYDFFLLFL